MGYPVYRSLSTHHPTVHNRDDCDVTPAVSGFSRDAIGSVPMAGTCVANNSGQLSAAVRKYTKAVGSRRAALKAPPALPLLSSSVTLPLLPTTSVIIGSQVKTNQELVISGENVIIDSFSVCVFIDVLQLSLSSLV